MEEALCWGWIDGVVRSLDADSFEQRYSPRKAKSNWSRVNIARMRQLIASGKAAPPGIAAFERRDKIAAAPYSFENRHITLSPAFLKRLKANPKAWKFFQSEPPGYRRTTVFWVMQAKKEETRERRFRTMLTRMAKGERMGILPKKPRP
ncbi:MAG TPA: YdeI/OmpD-associated family protein [Gemmatimonadales bacterium]|nr:YdeI/OmpD-associated family protein [Gemmatimonadales bacterium]